MVSSIYRLLCRVLLERLIVNRPHPWGLLITFIELIKKPTVKFWSHKFGTSPEIPKLFESVARSCMLRQLARYLSSDIHAVVRETCVVALDMAD